MKINEALEKINMVLKKYSHPTIDYAAGTDGKERSTEYFYIVNAQATQNILNQIIYICDISNSSDSSTDKSVCTQNVEAVIFSKTTLCDDAKINKFITALNKKLPEWLTKKHKETRLNILLEMQDFCNSSSDLKINLNKCTVELHFNNESHFNNFCAILKKAPQFKECWLLNTYYQQQYGKRYTTMSFNNLSIMDLLYMRDHLIANSDYKPTSLQKIKQELGMESHSMDVPYIDRYADIWRPHVEEWTNPTTASDTPQALFTKAPPKDPLERKTTTNIKFRPRCF